MNIQVNRKPLQWGNEPLAGLMEVKMALVPEFEERSFVPKHIKILHRAGTYVLHNFETMSELDIQYHISICEVGIKDVYRMGLDHFGQDGIKSIQQALASLARLEVWLLDKPVNQFTKLAVIATRAKLRRLLQL